MLLLVACLPRPRLHSLPSCLPCCPRVQRQEAEAVAQWQAADQRFQEVLGQMVEEQSSMVSSPSLSCLCA